MSFFEKNDQKLFQKRFYKLNRNFIATEEAPKLIGGFLCVHFLSGYYESKKEMNLVGYYPPTITLVICSFLSVIISHRL